MSDEEFCSCTGVCLITVKELPNMTLNMMHGLPTSEGIFSSAFFFFSAFFSVPCGVVVVVGAFPRLRGFWEEGSMIHSPPAFFFLKWKSASTHQFHFFFLLQGSVHKRAETTVAECSLTSCVRARFPQ